MFEIDQNALPDVFMAKQAHKSGISQRMLYHWRDEGKLEQVAWGIFSNPGFIGDLDLAEIVLRANCGTLCLASALSRHGLIDDIPQRIHVALPRSNHQPRTSAPVVWHRFDESTFDVGRESLSVSEELTIGIYDAPRSICDAFRYGHLIGRDMGIQAMRSWLRIRGNTPAKLAKQAETFPKTLPKILGALELLS